MLKTQLNLVTTKKRLSSKENLEIWQKYIPILTAELLFKKARAILPY